MNDTKDKPEDRVAVVDYDPAWPAAYNAERSRIQAAIGATFEQFEHIGSTAVPGLASKPVIDMMAAVPTLEAAQAILPTLDALGYRLVETGMLQRLFLVYQASSELRYHLHIVETASWEERKERHLRDYLRADPAQAQAYGRLKRQLATEYPHDSLGYTRAKTDFLQKASDAIRDAQNLPRIDVWKE